MQKLYGELWSFNKVSTPGRYSILYLSYLAKLHSIAETSERWCAKFKTTDFSLENEKLDLNWVATQATLTPDETATGLSDPQGKGKNGLTDLTQGISKVGLTSSSSIGPEQAALAQLQHFNQLEVLWNKESPLARPRGHGRTLSK
ncbi:hypothetical protein WH47_04448 [Habropoda laboriosa]|uniref:Uncharacterized protein n=1 Tax=Habropoda laboriosa TaxID=597456 RepID=A0A0L7QWQ0_9HYME|nr:hypothetical protein WH47_04448 [Habropoda laboriosa]